MLWGSCKLPNAWLLGYVDMKYLKCQVVMLWALLEGIFRLYECLQAAQGSQNATSVTMAEAGSQNQGKEHICCTENQHQAKPNYEGINNIFENQFA